jgi:hypothetical protein
MASIWFLRFGIVFALIGLGLGIYMGATHEFQFSPVHAHINLVGWASMFLAGLFYRTHPEADTKLALLHLGIAVPGLILLASGIYGSIAATAWAAPVVGAGSVLTLLAFILFAVIVFRSTGRKPVAPAAAE